MRAANCWRRAMSLPWACLMKGCSRRWVTDGRASKSFIRHLKATKYHTVTSKTLRQTNCPSSVYKSEWIKQLSAVTWTLRGADLSGSTVSDTHTSAVPLASVFKRGSLIDPSPRTTWSLSPWPRVQTSPAVAQRQVLSVICSVCQQVMSLCDTGLPAATLQPLMSVCWYKGSSNIDSSAPHTHTLKHPQNTFGFTLWQFWYIARLEITTRVPRYIYQTSRFVLFVYSQRLKRFWTPTIALRGKIGVKTLI